VNRNLISLALLLLLSIGCAKTIRPGSIDAVDSRTYDTLLIAQSILDNAKIAVVQGKLTDSAKPVINRMGEAYNLLRDLWLQYRATPNAAIEQKIIAATLTVNQFILDLRGMGVK